MSTISPTTLALLLAMARTAAGAEGSVTSPDAAEPPLAAPTTASDDAGNREDATAASSTTSSPSVASAKEQPLIGWRFGQRAPMYVGLLLLAQGFVEDDDQRLTTRKSNTLEGIGGLLRVGAVLDLNNRVGVRMQSFFRPTKKYVRAHPSVATANNDDWGAVEFAYMGPEYLYTTPFGLYAAGSIGFGTAMSQSTLGCNDDCCHCDDDSACDANMERASFGGAVIGSLGYEWRANKWLALSAEAFGGFYHGISEDEQTMNSAIFGMGMGLGF